MRSSLSQALNANTRLCGTKSSQWTRISSNTVLLRRTSDVVRPLIFPFETFLIGIWLTRPPTEKNQEISTLNTYASHISPEVQLCEGRLASTIEGVGKDRLLVRFSSIDPADPDREATFVLDISTQNYKGSFTFIVLSSTSVPPPLSHCLTPFFVEVITSSPSLPSMSILVNNLNDTRNIYAFIREVRAAYCILVCESFTQPRKAATKLGAQLDPPQS